MPTPAEELNEALRDLIDVVRTCDFDGVDLRAATKDVRELAHGLRTHVVDGMRMQAALVWAGFDAEAQAHVGHEDEVDDYALQGQLNPNEFFPYSPVVGRLNPISPPVEMWRADGDAGHEIHGSATFPPAFNGPPDSVHGGVIAEAFDELLGCVCVTNGLGGFTGTLTVIYRSPTPLNTPLTLRGWHDRTDGKKIYAKGTLHNGDVLCAEAEGIFVRSNRLPGGGVPADHV